MLNLMKKLRQLRVMWFSPHEFIPASFNSRQPIMQTAQDITERITERLNLFARGMKVPAVIGGLVSEQGLVAADVVGVRRRGSPEPATLHDQWHIGSCGKSITAALYARLVESGTAKWGASVFNLFPDLQNRIHPAWAERSIDEVLWCRSGLRANLGVRSMLRFWKDTRALPEQRTDAVLEALSRPPVRPGRFVYSNLGYIVVGAAIERLAGKAFEDALRQEMLDPLGMKSLGYGAPPTVCGHGTRINVPGLHLFSGPPKEPDHARSDNPAVLSSAGTLHVTLEDWSRFQRLFLTGGGGWLQAASIKRLLSLPEGDGTPMAMGWARADELPGVSFGMQGSNTLWSATAVMDEPRRHIALVVCNDGRSSVLHQSAHLAADILVLA